MDSKERATAILRATTQILTEYVKTNPIPPAELVGLMRHLMAELTQAMDALERGESLSGPLAPAGAALLAANTPATIPANTSAAAPTKSAAGAAASDSARPREKVTPKAAKKSGESWPGTRDPTLGPAVPVSQSVQPDFICCLECGQKFSMIKRHLKEKHGYVTADNKLDHAAYRAKWHLPDDYPIVAPHYAETKRNYAQSVGLGKYARVTEDAEPAER